MEPPNFSVGREDFDPRGRLAVLKGPDIDPAAPPNIRYSSRVRGEQGSPDPSGMATTQVGGQAGAGSGPTPDSIDQAHIRAKVGAELFGTESAAPSIERYRLLDRLVHGGMGTV
jgi:hypothetical protein